MTTWGKVSEINPRIEETWKSRFFLTIDVDWAPDFIIEYCKSFIEDLGIPSTWFLTHKSQELSALNHQGIERGTHCNFLSNFVGQQNATGSEVIVRSARELVPEAVSFRNHSLVQSSRLLDQFAEQGFTHECNLLLPYIPVEFLAPWRHWNGLIRVPHCWEDDVWLLGGCQDLSSLLRRKHGGLVVIDVHPIHLYMNTSDWLSYEKCKGVISDREQLEVIRIGNTGFGVRDALESAWGNLS